MVKRIVALILILCLGLGTALALSQPMDDAAWQRIRQNLENGVPHPVPEEYRIAVKSGDWHAAWKEKDTLSILVMGTDSETLSQRDGEADVIMVASVNLKNGAIRLLSLPETHFVQVESLPDSVWLKHVHCFGGPELMVQTVNDLMGLPLTKYCAVNLNSFVSTLDQLGGVKMNLSAYDAEALGLSAGENVLTGSQALDYMKLQGEGTRQTRARTPLTALGRQVSETLSLRTMATLLNFVITAIDTNLTYDNLMDIMFAVMDGPAGLSISADGVDFESGDWRDYSAACLYGE